MRLEGLDQRLPRHQRLIVVLHAGRDLQLEAVPSSQQVNVGVGMGGYIGSSTDGGGIDRSRGTGIDAPVSELEGGYSKRGRTLVARGILAKSVDVSEELAGGCQLQKKIRGCIRGVYNITDTSRNEGLAARDMDMMAAGGCITAFTAADGRLRDCTMRSSGLVAMLSCEEELEVDLTDCNDAEECF